MNQTGEVSILVTTSDRTDSYLSPVHFESRRSTLDQNENGDIIISQSRRPSSALALKEMLLNQSRRPSNALALHRPSMFVAQRKFILDLFTSPNGSQRSLNAPPSVLRENHLATVQKQRNRRLGK